MKNQIKVLSLFVLTIIFMVPNVSQAKIYTLVDGSEFDGTEQEYKCANLMTSIESDIYTHIKSAWNKSSKQYKLPSIKSVISKAKLSGNAKYNSKTGEFSLDNSNGESGVVFEYNHKLAETKVVKLINKFISEMEKILNNLESKIGQDCDKLSENATENSDYDIISSGFYDLFYNIGHELGDSLKYTYYDIEGSTNKDTEQPVLTFGFVGKNRSLGNNEKESYYFNLPTVFNEPYFFTGEDLPLKKYYINFILDSMASPNTILKFKLKDIRLFSSLKAEEVFPSFISE